jgi:hypothetical protein
MHVDTEDERAAVGRRDDIHGAIAIEVHIG